MQSINISIAGILLGLLICISEAQYDLDSVYEQPPSQQDDFLSPRTQLARLFSRLQTLDSKLSERTNLKYRYPAPQRYIDTSRDVPSYYDLSDDLSDSTAIGGLRKRQSSTGAQICIWKVCPPSPWRRAGKPGTVKSGRK